MQSYRKGCKRHRRQDYQRRWRKLKEKSGPARKCVSDTFGESWCFMCDPYEDSPGSKHNNSSRQNKKILRRAKAIFTQFLVQLTKLGPVAASAQALWQAAPHLLPKDSKAKLRMSLNLRPVKISRKAENWAMPNNGAKLSDFGASQYFHSLGFHEGYGQWPYKLNPAMHVGLLRQEEPMCQQEFCMSWKLVFLLEIEDNTALQHDRRGT